LIGKKMDALKTPVLVLNKLWTPIRVIPSIRAFTLLFAGKASVVDVVDYAVFTWDEWSKVPAQEGEPVIHTSNANIKLPEVIVLSNYDKLPKKGMKLTKRNIFLRDNFTCQYSGKTVNTKTADIDHIIPKSRGGTTSWDNLVVCSKTINREKADKTPQEAGLKLLKKPGRPEPQVIYIDPRMDMPDSWAKFISKKA
jgi:5-methylcytosine-specific restriction endonuclease McrA